MKTTVSLLTGFLIGVILFKLLYQTDIHKGPDSNIVKKRVYTNNDGKCFRFEPLPYLCGL